MFSSPGRSLSSTSDVAALASRRLCSGEIGLITGTAAEYTIAGLAIPGGTPSDRAIIRSIFLRTSAPMDVAIGFTFFNYVVNALTVVQNHVLGNTGIITPFNGHNAGPNFNLIRRYYAVPTTGITITDVNIELTTGTQFVAVGGTVNTGLQGWATWYEGPEL